MKKILMISGNGATQITQGKRGAFYNTLEELHKHFDRIDIIAPGSRWLPKSYPTTKIFGNVTIHPSTLPLWLQPLWIYLKGMQIYHESQYDLIVVHEYLPFYNGMGAQLLWRKIKHIPQLYEIFHVPGHPNAATTKEKIYKFITKAIIKLDTAQAKAVRVMNKKQVPEFLVSAGINKEKLVEIPAIYIDMEVFRPIKVEKKYDLISVGRFAQNKGLELLIDAVELVKEKNPEIRLLLVGDGPEKPKIESIIKNRKLSYNIIVHGWAKDQAEIAYLMNSSRAFITTSYNEGGPRVNIEAMACGIPVITTDIGMVPDIITHGENGIIIEWNALDIANKIHFLFENEYREKGIGENGRKIAQKFEKSQAISYYARKINELAS